MEKASGNLFSRSFFYVIIDKFDDAEKKGIPAYSWLSGYSVLQ